MSLATRIAEEFNIVRSQAVAKELLTVEANTVTNGYVKKGELVYGNTPNTFHEDASILNIGGELYSTEGEELVTNGDFSDGTTGFTDYSNGFVNIDNKGVFNNTGFITVNGASGTAGEPLKVSIFVEEITSARFRYDTGATIYTLQEGLNEFEFISNGATFQIINDSGTLKVDNISVKELTEIKLPQAPTANVETSTTTTNAYSVGEFAVLDRPELVTNGTFETVADGEVGHDNGDGTVDGWSNLNCNLSVESNKLKITTTQNTTYSYGYKAFDTIIGKEYVATVYMEKGTGTVARVYCGMSEGSPAYGYKEITSGSYTYTFKFVPTTTTTYLSVAMNTQNIGVTAYFDNISVKQVDEIYQATRNTADMYDLDLPTSGIFSLKNGEIVKYNGGAIGTVGNYYQRLAGDITNQLVSNYNFSVSSSWKDLGTASNMSLLNPYFEVCDRVFAGDISFHRLHKTTKALDTVSFRTLGNNPKLEYETGLYTADEVAMQPLADMSNNIVKNLNKAGSDLYEDSDYYYVLITATPRLNKGAYHPVFNAFGTSKLMGVSWADDWYTSVVLPYFQSVSSCFLFAPDSNLLIGYLRNVNGQHYNGSIAASSGGSGRPESKFYDKIYDSGLGGTIPLRISAKEYTNQELLEIGKNRATNPDFVEYGVECVYISNTRSTSTSESRLEVKLPLSEAQELFKNGDTVYHNGKAYVVDYVSYHYSNDTYIHIKSEYQPVYSVLNEPILYTKQNNIPTYKTSTTTDVIGSPSHYPTLWLDRLAEGKSLDFNPLLVGQDGSNYITQMNGTIDDYILSSKCNSLPYNNIYSGNSGSTWSPFSITSGTSGNQLSNITNAEYIAPQSVSTVLIPYTSQNKPSASTPLPVVYADDKVYATNSHSIYKGAMITASATDKIAVGNGSNGFEQKVLENVVDYGLKIKIGQTITIGTGETVTLLEDFDYGKTGQSFKRTGTNWTNHLLVSGELFNDTNYWVEDTPIFQHNTISLDNSNSSACKWYTTIAKDSEDNAVMQVQSKEMIWDYSADNGDNFVDVLEGNTYSIALNQTVEFRNFTIVPNGFYTRKKSAITSTAITDSFMSSLRVSATGDLIDTNGLVYWEPWDGNGFGDNNEFDYVTLDLNGNTIKTKTISYKLPYKVKGE